jgi:hypothetical protein
VTYDVLTPGVARLWPYSPDWSRPFDVKRSFLTDVATSRDKTEQRRATRDEPRLSVQYQAVVSGADRRAADHHLRSWQNKPVVVPDFVRWTLLTGSSSSGGSTLTIASPPSWIAADQPLVLCKAGVFEEVLVTGVVGATITLDDPLVNDWDVGDVIRPTFFGLFDGKIASTRPNGGTASISVSIDCYPGGEPSRDAGSAWAMLGGIEVFTPMPDYASAPNVSHLWPVDQIDFGRGRTAQFRPVDFMARMLEAQFNGLAPSEAAQIEQFFDRMKGMRTAFYAPTWEDDFGLAASALSGSSAFLASGSALADDFGSIDYAVVNEGVAVCLTDGSILYRRISDISASVGKSLVTVNAAWGVALSTANVARISRMPLSRFASDELTMSWQTPLSAGSSLGFQQVKA